MLTKVVAELTPLGILSGKFKWVSMSARVAGREFPDEESFRKALRTQQEEILRRTNFSFSNYDGAAIYLDLGRNPETVY